MRFLRQQRRRVVVASVLAGCHQGGEALVPVVVGLTIDAAVATGDLPALVRWLVVLAAVFALLSFSFRWGHRAAERASALTEHRVRELVVARVLAPEGGVGGQPGELVHVATGDARRVGLLALAVPTAVSGLVGLVVAAVALFTMSAPLGALVLVSAALVVAATRYLARPLERRGEVEQERAARAAGVAADLVAGLRALKGIHAETAAARRYRAVSRESLTAAVAAARTRGVLDGAVTAMTGVFLAAVALVGGRLALAGEISVGDLVAAVGLAQFAVWPLTSLSWVAGEIALSRASKRRVLALTSAAPAVTGGTGALPADLRGEVSLAGLRVAAGEHVGVVAQDGAGLVDRLALEVPDPTLTLDGHPLHAVPLDQARAAVVVSPHQVDLFAGTPRTTVGDHPALTAVGALPDRDVAELSGGQRQRVALARALATDAPVLVLHDPTTAVDPFTEAGIAAALAALRRGRTTIVVTTSPTLLAAMDRVVFGEVTGSHADLARDNADYRAVVFA
ncbi:ABC transporter transmembrane domain-containing protein [Actinokineospora sp. G85]|uniref:ABC transporter transmembrane domain-containing protein n=1 Tax=Actinokineospora sp. G85 TaxID=3406626 RepID=UPI003C75FF60